MARTLAPATGKSDARAADDMHAPTLGMNPAMNRIFCVVLFVSIGSSIITPMLGPIIFSDAGFFPSATNSDRMVAYSYVMAVYALGMIFGNPLWGALSDRLGRRSAFIISLTAGIFGLAFSLASIIYAAFFLFILGRWIDGLMAGRRTIALSMLSSASTDKLATFRKTEILNASGLLLGPLLGGMMVPSGDHLPLHHYGAPLVLMLALTIINIFLVPRQEYPTAHAAVERPPSILALLRSNKSITLYLTFFLFQIGWHLFFLSLLPYAVIHYKFTPFQLGLFSTAQVLIYILILLVLSPRLKRKTSEGLYAESALFIGIISLLAIWSSGNKLMVFALASAAMISATAIVIPIFSKHIAELGHGSHDGATIGVQNGIIGCAWLLAALSNGFMTQNAPLHAFLLAAACFFSVAIILRLYAVKRHLFHF